MSYENLETYRKELQELNKQIEDALGYENDNFNALSTKFNDLLNKIKEQINLAKNKIKVDSVNQNKAGEVKVEAEVKRGRGRPKKEVNTTGEFVIKSDKEFEEALLRAEKLMRKNEEPLSASQTKRIEKQIKELVDAMTKYKEER